MTTTAEQGAQLVAEALELFHHVGRSDLVARLEAARQRSEQAKALVCVIGSYKAGKSSLINSIVGQDVTPVHHHNPTALPVMVDHAETAEATLITSEGGTRSLELDASHTAILDPEEDARLVHIAIPSPVTEMGLTVLDTPGIGGLTTDGADAAVMLARDTDAVLFVADSGSELTRREVAFLDRIHAEGPFVAVALTKIDLHPHWQQIKVLDEAHIAHLEDVPVIGVSAELRTIAIERSDAELNAASGIPVLLRILDEAIGLGDREAASVRTLDVADGLTHDLQGDLERKLAMVENPDAVARLNEAELVLEGLMREGSRWRGALGTGLGELRRRFDRGLDHALEDWERFHRERLEEIDPATDWVDYEAELLSTLRELLDERAAELEDGARTVAADVASLLADEGPNVDIPFGESLPDPANEWQQRVGERKRKKPNALATGFNAVRGAQGGLITLGMMGGLIGLSLVGPLAIGVGALFAAKQARDYSKTTLEQRRAEAGALVGRLKMRIHREMSYFSNEAFTTTSRSLEDHFTERIKAIHADLTAQVEAAKASVSATAEERQRLHQSVTQAVDRTTRLSTSIGSLLMQFGRMA